MNNQQTPWVQWIHLVEWWYNSTYHTSTKMSPFESLYGYPPPTTREYVINYFKVLAAMDYLETSDQVICILKESYLTIKKLHQTTRRLKNYRSIIWIRQLGVCSPSTVQTNFTKKFQKIINFHPSSMGHIKFKSDWYKWPML